jgi:hypothetical protein
MTDDEEAARNLHRFLPGPKPWMASTHFLTKRLPRVSTETSLHVLAHNLKRVMQIVGIVPLMQDPAVRSASIDPQFPVDSFTEKFEELRKRFSDASQRLRVDSLVTLKLRQMCQSNLNRRLANAIIHI